MEEVYRKRLAILTCNDDSWEEFTPFEQEDAGPGQANRDCDLSRTVPHNKHENSVTERAGESVGKSAKVERRANTTTTPSQQQSRKPIAAKRQRSNIGRQVVADYGLFSKTQICPESEPLCPWRYVTQYPHTFVGKANSVWAAPYFEEAAVFKDRAWDFFYLYNPQNLKRTPILFVPTCQFRQLLDFVNEELDTELTIPDGKNTEKFNLHFGQGQTPQPRFLGRFTNPKTSEELIKDIPPWIADDSLDGVSTVAKEHFLEQLQTIHRTVLMVKKKNKGVKARLNRIAAHKAWGRSIKRVQRHLTIKQGDGSFMNPPGVKLVGDVVFASIDVEAYEFNQNIVTEVGIAVFDAAIIRDRGHGDLENDLFPLIKVRHIRIKEHLWAQNTRYVKGCAGKFDFGESEFIKKKRVASLIGDILEEASFVKPVVGETPAVRTLKRPLVLVFHDPSQDMKYMKTLDCELSKITNVVQTVDTQTMHQYIERLRDPRKLETILKSLKFEYRNLHNAGNDAAYTMQAMIGLAVKKHEMVKETPPVDDSEPKAPRTVLEDEGWTSSEDE